MEEINIRCNCCKKCIGAIHIKKLDLKSKKIVKKAIKQSLCKDCLGYLIIKESIKKEKKNRRSKI